MVAQGVRDLFSGRWPGAAPPFSNLGSAVFPVLLWVAYQYLLIVYAGRFPDFVWLGWN